MNDWRVRITLVAGMVAGVAMVLLGMEPRLILVGLVAISVSATGWLIFDVGKASSSIVWHDYGAEGSASAGPDRRVQFLQSRLRTSARRRSAQPSTDDGDIPPDEIVDTLVAVIDDHLSAEHGIDRSISPHSAATVLGPELARFVSDPNAGRSMTQQKTLARTLALIEELTTA